MRTPSIKTLSEVFEDPAAAKRIFISSHASLRQSVAGAARIAECWNMPAWHDIRLTCLNALDPGLFGVESVQSTTGEYADYINTGDTYAPTVIFWRGKYRVQSIGDFIETQSAHFK